MQSNQITDISSISKLINLKTLNLSNNTIVEVLPLATCNQLTSLNLKGNTTLRTEYTDEERVKLLEISQIMIARKGTINVDIDKLSLFNGYTKLDLSNQKLTDLSLLEGQTELTSLNLDNNQITLADEKSQKILKGMKKLTSLTLNSNNLTDISAINCLEKLTQLHISGDNNNVNLQQIEDRISSIGLYCNTATLKTLENCTPSKITKLSMNYARSFSSLPDLSKLTSLSNLDLTGNDQKITNIEEIGNAKSLTELSLRLVPMHGRMIDVSKLTNLKSLNLSGCGLWTDELESLRGLKNNENLTIDLTSNALIDPEILLELPSHFKIRLGGNVNISESFKTRLREYFGKNVTF